jgi:hypothetical protein
MVFSADGWASGENITPKRGQSYPDERSEAKSNYPINVEERTPGVYEYAHPEWTIAMDGYRSKRNAVLYLGSGGKSIEPNSCASVVFFCFIFLRVIYSQKLRPMCPTGFGS